MRDTMLNKRAPFVPLLCVVLLLFSVVFLSSPSLRSAIAAPPPVTTAITGNTVTGNFSTQILPPPPGGKIYGIQGGQTVGSNLFHSFAQFNVGPGDVAQFQTSNLSQNTVISNILGRINGQQSPSSIFGTIDSATYYPAANLFLMNPYGFLFGPKATVNVGGMVAFSGGDYLRLQGNGGNGIFYADAAQTSLLTSAPVAAFGFLGSNPGAITVQGSQLSVAPGQSLSLVGGNITIQSGALDNGTVQSAKVSAKGGQINLVSVASPGEVLYPSLQTGPNVNGQSFSNMGNIALSQGSVLDVSADAAGTISIHGGQLVITDGMLLADTGNTNGAQVAIDINVTGNLSISDTRGVPAITARTFGSGDAGEIKITSGNLTATSSFSDPTFNPFTLIDSHTEGTGKGGNVTITATGALQSSGPQDLGFAFTLIDSGTAGPGHGGNVTITAQNIQLDSTNISTGDYVARNILLDSSGVSGSAGNLTITANSLRLNNSNFTTEAFAAFPQLTQQGGDITLNVGDINMLNSQISLDGIARSGALTINANTLHTDFTFFETATVSGPGGGITVNARSVELINGSAFLSSTQGDGNAGDIHITATDHISLLGDVGTNPLAVFQPSGLFSNSSGDAGSQGNAGNIFVTTPSLNMVGGRINTVTQTSGHGGNVTITVPGSISMSGEFLSSASEVPSIFDIGPLAPSGIVTSTIGGACSGPCGNAGNISVTTGSLSIQNGGRIDSGTGSTGLGGNVTIAAANTISLSGTLLDGTPVGIFSRSIGTTPDAGTGGNISLTAGQSVAISNGASVSASSIGPGATGNIQINAGNQFTMMNSTVTTEASQSRGGTIKISTNPNGTVQLIDSKISASVLDGTGGGGSVSIDPQFVLLQNSQILANAVFGPGGNIFITTNLLLPDSTSVISASSQFGENGTITIQSPIAPASGKILPLPQKPLIATTLLSQRCAALAGGNYSSFTVAGRDSLPAEPAGWLSSPLTALGEGTGRGARGERVDANTPGAGEEPETRGEGEGLSGLVRLSGSSGSSDQQHETNQTNEHPVVSLRRIAPPGFLTQSFAADWSAGCAS